MRIAVDAMGGDRAPGVIVEGAALAARELRGVAEIVLVGPERILREEVARQNLPDDAFELIHAPQVVEMTESPAAAVRKKPDSSIAVCARAQREGRVDAMVSAGNTGAVVVSSLLTLGRLRHVNRPGIATFMPTESGGCVLIDVGANAECKPFNLLQFGAMGSVYARMLLDRETPRVALLNIGSERSKGSGLVQTAHDLMAASPLNFTGNVEGYGVFRGEADVVVCDGFVGNVILKFTESVVGLMTSTIRSHVDANWRSRLGGVLLKPALSAFRSQLDYSEYGGAPLLGVAGVSIIGHGGSSAKAVKNAIKVAGRFVQQNVNAEICRQLEAKGYVRARKQAKSVH
ncbi:MAG: phosphate acyltransferase PlsX [Candidatus Eisenbacteria sp.]|nr:phosphate acyltransferase PlsX [Candidatus Eisenbacteria bacterium]